MIIKRINLTFFLLFNILYSISAQEIYNDDATFNKGKVEWQWRVTVGDIPYNKPVKAEFVVKNNSNQPLIIKDVQTACHCTIIDYPKEPIEEGKSATIIAIYDAKSEGPFFKIITVKTNFDPDHLVPLAMVGNVKSKSK